MAKTFWERFLGDCEIKELISPSFRVLRDCNTQDIVWDIPRVAYCIILTQYLWLVCHGNETLLSQLVTVGCVSEIRTCTVCLGKTQHSNRLWEIYTVPVKSLDTPTHSRFFLYFDCVLHCIIIVKTSKLWTNTWNHVVTKKVLNIQNMFLILDSSK
jgi:hypothetical protein